MSKTVLDIQSVSRTYGKGNAKVYAINDISLSLKSGQFVLIVGSSGSGKSTLLNIMGMLDRPTSGVVFIDGMDSRKLDEDQISALRNKKNWIHISIFKFTLGSDRDRKCHTTPADS